MQGSFRREGLLELNPEQAAIGCDPLLLADLDPAVRFMAVGYESRACERSDAVTASAEDYVRGCINERCAERSVEGCANLDPESLDASVRFTCDDESATAFGRIECGCGRSYGGATARRALLTTP